ncbi:hypothetical protein GN956_G4117 [Arapaima gigas]
MEDDAQHRRYQFISEPDAAPVSWSKPKEPSAGARAQDRRPGSQVKPVHSPSSQVLVCFCSAASHKTTSTVIFTGVGASGSTAAPPVPNSILAG